MKVIINEVSIVIGLVQDKYKTNITLINQCRSKIHDLTMFLV